MEKYKKRDRVKFVSDQPLIYASRYAIGDYKVEKEEYIGIIRDVHPLMEDIYLYTIVTTTPIHWICLVQETEIIGKLFDE